MDIETLKQYLKPDFVASIDPTYFSSMCEGVWDYVQNYTNWPTNKPVPPGLVMVCADMVAFYTDTRTTYKEMKTDDMTLVFNTSLPDTIVRRLTVYRRLRW